MMISRVSFYLFFSMVAVGQAFYLRSKVGHGITRVTSMMNDEESPEIPRKDYKNFEEYFNRPGAWDDKDLEPLLKANKAWNSRMVQADPGYFKHHEIGHAPKVIIDLPFYLFAYLLTYV